MAGELFRTLPAAKALFDRASERLGYDRIAVCVGGPAERLNATLVIATHDGRVKKHFEAVLRPFSGVKLASRPIDTCVSSS